MSYEIIKTTEKDLEKSKYIKDCEFIKRLISENFETREKTWREFIDLSAGMIAWHRKHLEDFNLTIDDLVSETYLYLTENNNKRLKDFLIKGKFLEGFIYNKIKGAKSRLLYPYQKKREYEVSDSRFNFPHSYYEMNEISKDKNLFYYHDVLKQAFNILWQSNSQRAYIYMMRRKMELPSKQVASVLGISVNNVDVTLIRAEKDMKAILEELGNNNDILQD